MTLVAGHKNAQQQTDHQADAQRGQTEVDGVFHFWRDDLGDIDIFTVIDGFAKAY